MVFPMGEFTSNPTTNKGLTIPPPESSIILRQKVVDYIGCQAQILLLSEGVWHGDAGAFCVGGRFDAKLAVFKNEVGFLVAEVFSHFVVNFGVRFSFRDFIAADDKVEGC